MNTVVPVVLSGGAGSRLWPLSRERFPKQFHRLVGRHTLLQETVRRLPKLPGFTAPLVVCNHEHRFLVAEQLRQIDVKPLGVFLEPAGRNTAPAAAIGALAGLAAFEDPLLLVLPADHVISEEEAFHDALASAAAVAARSLLVCFGVPPTRPETGYGYVRCGARLEPGGSSVPQQTDTVQAYQVERFVEKPDAETARRYLETGTYLWNSGMFMFRAQTYLEELERFEPGMFEQCRRAFASRRRDLDFDRLGSAFADCPANSIDYAVMERSRRVAVLPLKAGWSDVGSWTTLWEVGHRDADGNVTVGDVLSSDVRNCYLHSHGRLLAVIGLDDCVVVETDDAVLVAPRERAQDVKALVDRLRALGREESVLHRRVLRPWGSYQGVDHGERFQVKRLIVSPGAKLSLQLHQKRAEHWVVVRGRARVTVGDRKFVLEGDQSTYIPVGTKHQLENVGEEPLEIIEVQTGAYLGEDDIVRFEDQYGRV